jgi:hypothetical protein
MDIHMASSTAPITHKANLATKGGCPRLPVESLESTMVKFSAFG